MNVAVQLEPAEGELPRVVYRWDPDTEILIASLDGSTTRDGMSGSVELMGSDGSWLALDVSKGRIRGVEVAVWPEVETRAVLAAPTVIDERRIVIPSRASQPGIASVGVDSALVAETNEAESIIHFRLGKKREVRTVRLADDVLVELDAQKRIAGMWFLNVPPFPATGDAS